MNLLENRLAVITGAASGIGEASANLFAENGAKVLAFDLDDSIIEKFKDNNSITGFKLDIASSSAPEIISNTIQEVLGGLDILMNNAGVVSGSPIEEMQDEEWDKVFAVNVEATIKITRCSLPYLKKSKFGRIINIGSIMSSLGDAGLSAYAASKHAVAGLTKSIAADFVKKNIRCNSIAPGTVFSPSWKDRVNQRPDPVQA